MKHLNELIYEKLKLTDIKQTIDIIPYFKQFTEMYLDKKEYKDINDSNFNDENFIKTINNFIETNKITNYSNILFISNLDSSYIIENSELECTNNKDDYTKFYRYGFDYDEYESCWRLSDSPIDSEILWSEDNITLNYCFYAYGKTIDFIIRIIK